jgi:hypothetical protein
VKEPLERRLAFLNKSVAGLRRTKLKGRRRTWDGSYLVMAAYNLTRMIRLLRPATA